MRLSGTPHVTCSVPQSATQPARPTIDVTGHPCENADVAEGSCLGPLWVHCPGGNTRQAEVHASVSDDTLQMPERYRGSKQPGWRNWQTRKLEVLVSDLGRAGSNPVPGIGSHPLLVATRLRRSGTRLGTIVRRYRLTQMRWSDDLGIPNYRLRIMHRGASRERTVIRIPRLVRRGPR